MEGKIIKIVAPVLLELLVLLVFGAEGEKTCSNS